VASQILFQASFNVTAPPFITLSFLFVGLLPELIQILNLFHVLVHLLPLARISKLVKFVILVLLLRRDVSIRYLVLVPQVHLLEKLEVLVFSEGTMLCQLFSADVTDFIQQVIGIGATGEVLEEWLQSFISFLSCRGKLLLFLFLWLFVNFIEKFVVVLVIAGVSVHV